MEPSQLYNQRPSLLPYYKLVWCQCCASTKAQNIAEFRGVHCACILRQSWNRLLAWAKAHNYWWKRNWNTCSRTDGRTRYYKKNDKAKFHSEQCQSIIIGGTEQPAFSSPRFVTKSITNREHALNGYLTGFTDHLKPSRLLLSTMTEELEMGDNHDIKASYRFVNERVSSKPFPSTLFIQVDNWTHMKRNRYVLARTQCLINWNVFLCLEIGFVLIGHTHEEIDQAFSRTPERLRS